MTEAAQLSFTAPIAVQSIDESQYDAQLSKKLTQLRSSLNELNSLAGAMPDIEVHESAKKHSVLGAPCSIRIHSFPVGSELMNDLMVAVLAEANTSPIIRERLFQVNFHTALSGDCMVTLVYHKQLDDVWKEAALSLRAKLGKLPATLGHTPQIIGRSRKQKVMLDRDWVVERLQVNDKEYAYRQVEGSFSQPNAGVCQHMLAWAQKVTTPGAYPEASSAPSLLGQTAKAPATRPPPTRATAAAPGDTTHTSQQGQPAAASALQASSPTGVVDTVADLGNQPEAVAGAAQGCGSPARDLLELYCGNGNFSIPLAQNFRRVVATELSKTSVEAAQHNITLNGVRNMFVARMSSEEFSEAWRTRARKQRLAGLGDWDSLALHTVLVDPPRAGLDPETVQMVSQFQRIVYISCNPETLIANLKELLKTHRMLSLAAFDQFPYTHHLECGVYLEKKN
ncbi:uracil-5--methyltransferase-domain-containing protein [Haematococcus lacustris]